MKAYLETIVITQQSSSSLRTTSASQIVLEFSSYDDYIMFNDQLDTHEKAPGFEVYRTLIPMM